VLDLDAKQALARRQRDGYALEFGAGTQLKKGIGARFRDEKDALAELLEGNVGGNHVLSEGLQIIERRSRSNGPSIQRFGELEAEGTLSVPLDEIAATIAHIWVNRVLRSAHRAQEYVIYDLLDRLYAGRKARQR
jgi:hypothetical protein